MNLVMQDMVDGIWASAASIGTDLMPMVSMIVGVTVGFLILSKVASLMRGK